MSPYAVSEGDKRRLILACASIDVRPFLLMDEPTYGLDYSAFATLVNSIRALKSRGVTIVMVTHSPELAHLTADRILVLDSGVLLCDAPPEELDTGDTALSEVFLPIWQRETV